MRTGIGTFSAMGMPALRYHLDLAVARSAPRLSWDQHEKLSTANPSARRSWAGRGDIPTWLAERCLALDADLVVRTRLVGLPGVAKDRARKRIAADGHRAAAAVAFRDDTEDTEAVALLSRIPAWRRHIISDAMALRHRRGGVLHGSECRIALALSEGSPWFHVGYAATLAERHGRTAVECRLRDGLVGRWRSFENGTTSRAEAFDLAYHQSPEWLKERFADTHATVARTRCLGEFYEPVEHCTSVHPWWEESGGLPLTSLGRLWPVYGGDEADLVCALAESMRGSPFVRAVRAVVRLTRSESLADLLDAETQVHESLAKRLNEYEPF